VAPIAPLRATRSSRGSRVHGATSGYGPLVTWKRTVVPVLVAASVLLTGCDQTKWIEEVGAPATPTDAAGLAAFLRDGTASIRSAHLELEVDAAGNAIKGAGDETLENGRAESFDLTETIPGLGDIRVLQVDGKTYVQLPSGLNPGDKPWLLISTESSNPVVQQLATSLQSVTSSSSLDQYTAFTQAATVKPLGSEQVDGVAATHYALSVDVTKLPNDTPGRSDLLTAGLVTLPVDLWVDAKGRPVKVSEELTVQNQKVTTLVTLSRFDEDVSITAPPADQVATD
jgi:hypothetical protein